MIEKPLDRLNYYNGQRLEASDLKLEQEYHIRTRRWINKSLYTAGIARGLDIRAEKDTRFVIVSPGLALDAEGQEILLLEEERICVPGKAHTNTSGSEAKVEGLYLTIRYNEKAIEEERNGCIPKGTNGKKNGDRAAWGGPALVRAKPLFNWSDALPYESSGEIVLAQVELTPDCTKVHQLNTGVRRYVGAASSAKVRQYALEGERHIDKANPGRIYFHVRGRQPNAVTLYLRAEQFSTLYYTEMGYHEHNPTVSNGNRTDKASNIDAHQHGVTALTVAGGSHTNHTATAFISGLDIPQPLLPPGVTQPPGVPNHMLGALPTIPAPGIPPTWPSTGNMIPEVGLRIGSGAHSHTLGGLTDVPSQVAPALHTHPLSVSVRNDPAGILSDPGSLRPVPKAFSARGDAPFNYVDDIQVSIGPDVNRLVNYRNDILNQLRAAQPTETWDKLGNGGGGHALAVKGTGEIKLDFLPNIAFTEGEYVIQLSVNSGGGRVLYNLYVE
jgi:hypothetical protein